MKHHVYGTSYTGFPSALQKIRQDRGMSQIALADAAGVTQSAISQMESGANYPSIETLFAIADALEVDVNQLVNRV